MFGLVYPNWAAAQARDVADVCGGPESTVIVALVDSTPVVFASVRYGNEGARTIGEIDMIAVDPDHPGHAPARALYERFGFRTYPQVRYCKPTGQIS